MVNWVPNKSIDLEYVNRLLLKCQKTNQFTNNGPNVQDLEKEIRILLEIDESKSVICISNGTHALHACVAAFEMYLNKELTFATQSFTFPASAQGYLKNTKIIDIDSSGSLDISQIPKDIDGIIVTNIFGNVCEIDKYVDWCNNNKKFLIFDNAATPYTQYKGINACNFGNASTISFHHTKPIGFGEGGCVIIDSKYEQYIRRVINFGFEKIPIPLWNRIGSNYKMSDIQAIFILQYLSNFKQIVNKHKQLTNYFFAKTNFKPFPNYSSETPFLSCFCFLVDNSDIKLKILIENQIYARKYYTPLENTPTASDFYSKIICIPCTIDMGYSDIDKIIELLK